MEKYIKDSSYRILGRITVESNGNETLRDSSGRILGYYNAAQDTTRDVSGRIVAYGNVLPCFLDFNPYRR